VILSLPVPPLIRSAPAPVSIVSLPAPPLTLSASNVLLPVIVSLPAEPINTSPFTEPI